MTDRTRTCTSDTYVHCAYAHLGPSCAHVRREGWRGLVGLSNAERFEAPVEGTAAKTQHACGFRLVAARLLKRFLHGFARDLRRGEPRGGGRWRLSGRACARSQRREQLAFAQQLTVREHARAFEGVAQLSHV